MHAFFFILVILNVKNVLGANILYVASIPSPSHHIWNRALAIGLVNKGHNVTLLDPDKEKLPSPANYTHIFMDSVYENLDQEYDLNEFATFGATKIMYAYQDWCLFSCQIGLNSSGLRLLLDYPPDFTFDLIIVDVTCGPCLYPIIHRFNYAPTIAATAFLLPSYVSYNFGNHLYPSYIPWYALPYSTDMNFMERVWNSVYMYVDAVFRNVRQFKKEHEIARQVFGENIPSMKELERHISLVLANTDPILDHPQSLAPNIIAVGGLHTRKSKNIPEDLQVLLDKAKNGVIVFSLGTNVRSDKLDNATREALLNAFSKIKQTVIWKFESDIDNLPKNVIVRKWLPQNDILGHPNVKLFIGHAGALSTQEAIYHGVPMICVPFIVDQHINTRIVVNKKLGVDLDYKRISTNYVLQKLKEVLENPVYSENMRKTSETFKDRPETPLERGVFWAEYVLRHGGAHFLNTPARDLPFYNATGLDVIAFLFVIMVTISLLFYNTILFIIKRFSGKNKVKVN